VSPVSSVVASVAVWVASVGKTLVVIGLLIAGVGLLVLAGVPIGRLPGDFYVRRGNVSFYFPLTTSIAVSILVTLIVAFFRR
jgi:hypothetical protein